MAMESLRVGIVGGGWIAQRHAPALVAADGVELVAACDSDLARAQLVAGATAARAYERWEEMLEHESLDALWVCTPPLTHRDPAVAALEAGIHVYVEKPIARTLPDAEAIVASAARSRAVCAVGYQWHGTELLDAIREATSGQTVGMLVGRNYGPVAARPWFTDRGQGGGQILERGSHHIDLQRAIAGEIASVEAVGGKVRLARTLAPQGDIEDVAALAFQFHSGALGSVNIAWTRDGQPELYAVDVIASNATLALELGPETFRLSGVTDGRELDVEASDPFGRSIDRFLEAVRDGDRSRVFCTPDDALRTLVVGLACERALTDGGAVLVPEPPTLTPRMP
jgi:myo-inositol 2-dehydrogenase/D-chiro-inositol 1-dehydrogenase